MQSRWPEVQFCVETTMNRPLMNVWRLRYLGPFDPQKKYYNVKAKSNFNKYMKRFYR